MKTKILAIIVLAAVSVASAQVNVQKVSGTNAITGNLTFSTGKTLTFDSGSTLAVNGSLATGAITASYSGAVSSFTRTGLNGAGLAGVFSLASDAKTNGDGIQLAFAGLNSSSVAKNYGVVYATIVDSVAGTEDGSTIIGAITNGTVGPVATFNGSGSTIAGPVRMSQYGAGAATFDSSGNITSVSDVRLKNLIRPFMTGLAAVRQLQPQVYTWKAETGLNTDDINVSLIAQDLIAAGIPEAVATQRTITGKDANGNPTKTRVDSTYTVSDRAVISALVNAIKELDARLTALEK